MSPHGGAWAIQQVTAAPITQVQKKAATLNQSTNSESCTFDASPTQGNLLISTIAGGGAANMTVTPPTGWTTAMIIDSNGATVPNFSGRWAAIGYKIAGAGETSAVTWTLGATVSCDLVAFEYSGMAAASPVDASSTPQSSSSTVTSLGLGTTGTTALAKELAVAFCCTANRSGEAVDNSFTLENAQTSRVIVGTKILSATGTVTCTASWTTANTAAGGIVTFKGS